MIMMDLEDPTYEMSFQRERFLSEVRKCQVWAILKNAVMNIHVQVCVWTYIFILLGKY